MTGYELRSTSGRGGFRVTGPLTKVGRANDNTVILNDPTISRYHLNCYIRSDGSLVIENAGSQNGFLLNGQPTAGPSLARHGDRIAFGSLEYLVLKDGLPPPDTSRPRPPTFTPVGGTVPFYEAAAKVRVPSGGGSGRLRLYGIVGAILALVVYMGNKGNDGETGRSPSSSDDAGESFGFSSALTTEGYKGARREPQSQSEIEADGYFRAGMRDFHNKHYTRALQYFQQARTKNPAHPDAAMYIEQAESRLKEQIARLLRDANRSFGYLQYGRAKLEAVQVLTLLADQIPAYSRKLASEAMVRKPDQPSPTNEEVLMRIDCKSTKDAESCQKAVKIITEARNRRGEENELR